MSFLHVRLQIPLLCICLRAPLEGTRERLRFRMLQEVNIERIRSSKRLSTNSTHKWPKYDYSNTKFTFLPCEPWHAPPDATSNWIFCRSRAGYTQIFCFSKSTLPFLKLFSIFLNFLDFRFSNLVLSYQLSSPNYSAKMTLELSSPNPRFLRLFQSHRSPGAS